MKKFLLLLFGLPTLASSQDIFNIDRYQMQLPMLNPALSGAYSNEFALGARFTTGVLRQPAMPIIRIDGYDPTLHSGLGISVTGTANQLEDENIYVRGNYNYQFNLKNGRLSAGVVLEYGKNEVAGVETSGVSSGFGAAYIATNWYVGVAAQQLVSLTAENLYQQPIYIASANYTFTLFEDFGLRPEAMFSYAEVEGLGFNVGAQVKYKFAYVGGAYIFDPYLYQDKSNGLNLRSRFGLSAGILVFKHFNLDYCNTTSGITDIRNTLTLRLFAPIKTL